MNPKIRYALKRIDAVAERLDTLSCGNETKEEYKLATQLFGAASIIKQEVKHERHSRSN